MEEDISIINSNTRNEKVRNFFINNKNKIISTIVVLIIVLVGAYSFDSYKTNKKKEISNKFNSTTLAYSENIKDLIIKNYNKDTEWSDLDKFINLEKLQLNNCLIENNSFFLSISSPACSLLGGLLFFALENLKFFNFSNKIFSISN